MIESEEAYTDKLANAIKSQRSANEMSKNNSVVPQAKTALDRFKMEAARETGVNLNRIQIQKSS